MLSVKIFEELKKIGISNQEVCEKLGWNANKATDIKRGKSSLSADELIKLADIFHISLDSLLGRQLSSSTIHNNGNSNLNLANNGNNNKFFSNEQESQLSEFESQLLEIYNNLDTQKKMKLLTVAFELKNKED